MNIRCIMLLCLSIHTLPSLAQEEIRVGVELQHYPPYSNVQNYEYRGYARDLLDAFATEHDYRFVYIPLPVKRLFDDFLSGRLDLKFPDHPQWNAEQRAGLTIHYSQPAAFYVDGILVKPEHLGQGKARIQRLGTQNGFTPGPYLADIRTERFKLIQTNQIDSLLRMALLDRVDGVYLSPQVAAYHLRKMRLPADALVFDSQLAHVKEHYHLSSIHQAQLIHEFDHFLEKRVELVTEIRLRHGL